MSVSLLHSDGIAVLTLDRPHRRNALDEPAWHALRDHCRNLPQEALRAVVVTGGGGHFCAGMDLSPDNPVVRRMGPALERGDDRAAYDLLVELKDCVASLTELELPTFAAIEGACVGGGLEIALACDVRIAAVDATLALPEVRVGMIPDLGGCARLTRLVGPGRAADLITTGRRVNGEEAFRLGFVERVVPSGTALAVAMDAARAVAANGPQAVRYALNAVRLAPDLGLAEALAVETRAGVLALTSGEPTEGITAFLERRAPRWGSV